MTVRKPRPVLPGDRIAIVAPASPFSRDEFERGAAELRRLGYEPVYDDTVFAREAGYLAGSAEVRAAALLRYWADPGVAAIVAARGGYGSVQILPLIAEKMDVTRPKLFVGYSDNTSLLSWLTTHHGLTALHGPMLDGRLSKGPAGYDEASFAALLQGHGRGLRLEPDGMDALQAGDAAGPLFGGTITQLAASLGTPYAFDPPAGCVLFLEDVNERPYRIDRLLTQLQLSGVIARARALVFGEMRGCHEPDSPGDGRLRPDRPSSVRLQPDRRAGGSNGYVTARNVVERLIRGFDGPVLYGFPSGHTTGPCWTLPLGVAVRVRSAPRPHLLVEDSPVA